MNQTLARITLACGLSVALIEGFAGCARKAAQEEPAAKAPAERAHGPEGKPIVRIEREAQARMGLVVAELEGRALQPQVEAYGRVVADPGLAWELRAPIAGTVRATRAWPDIGTDLPDGEVLGSIEPRLSPVERADLAARVASAKGDEDSARAALEVARAAFERAKALNAEAKNVSDRALEEAQGRVLQESARLSAAGESRSVLESALAPAASPAGALPLVLRNGGEVVDVRAHPGEAIEAGATILRIERFDPALVRVGLPIGASADGAERALVEAAAHPGQKLEGLRVAPAPTADSQGQTLLFRVSTGAVHLRPGEAVAAWIDLPLPPRDGAIVPRSAIVRHAGQTWIYVQKGDVDFVREEVALEEPTTEGWFVTAEWARGARAVVGGAQGLLSTEILGAAGGGAEEE